MNKEYLNRIDKKLRVYEKLYIYIWTKKWVESEDLYWHFPPGRDYSDTLPARSGSARAEDLGENLEAWVDKKCDFRSVGIFI